MKYTALT
jgi:hypothetical protein